VTVRVLAFARIREILGSASAERTVAAHASVAEVWEGLAREFPALAPLHGSTRFARNGAFVAGGQTLEDGDELALLPPFGGG
jgi:molybdopterin synthase catalytic subunit/molybdopterin synthase sulfur carrier subunit